VKGKERHGRWREREYSEESREPKRRKLFKMIVTEGVWVYYSERGGGIRN